MEMLRRNGPVMKSVESVLRLEGRLRRSSARYTLAASSILRLTFIGLAGISDWVILSLTVGDLSNFNCPLLSALHCTGTPQTHDTQQCSPHDGNDHAYSTYEDSRLDSKQLNTGLYKSCHCLWKPL